jgi:hypothetical protein
MASINAMTTSDLAAEVAACERARLAGKPLGDLCPRRDVGCDHAVPSLHPMAFQ